jgi:outer membrane lipoprotein-sorting protein
MRTLLLLLVTISATFAQAPTAQSVLDRYVEVTGGKDAYAKVKSVTMLGTMEIKGQNVKGEMKMYRQDGGKYYTVVDLPGVGKQEDGSNGNIVWDKTVLGPRIKTGPEKFLASCAKGALGEYNRGPIEMDTCYAKAEFAGEEVVDGKKTYKLKMTPKEGKPEEQYYDKESGLLVRTKMIMPSPMGEVPIVATVNEYREVDGVKTPVKLTNEMGPVAMIMTFTTVKFNDSIPDAIFALPPEIEQLTKAQKK